MGTTLDSHLVLLLCSNTAVLSLASRFFQLVPVHLTTEITVFTIIMVGTLYTHTLLQNECHVTLSLFYSQLSSNEKYHQCIVNVTTLVQFVSLREHSCPLAPLRNRLEQLRRTLTNITANTCTIQYMYSCTNQYNYYYWFKTLVATLRS